MYKEDCDDANQITSCPDFNPIVPHVGEDGYDEEPVEDESAEEDDDTLDYGDDYFSGGDYDDDLELGSEDAALSKHYIQSDMAKILREDILAANLSTGCKKAFLEIVGLYYSKDMFLAYITRPDTIKLNLKLALQHVHLSSIPHDVEQPIFLQLVNNITETFPIVASHAFGGRERYLQGLKRSEARSGEIEKFAPNMASVVEPEKKKSFRILRR